MIIHLLLAALLFASAPDADAPAHGGSWQVFPGYDPFDGRDRSGAVLDAVPTSGAGPALRLVLRCDGASPLGLDVLVTFEPAAAAGATVHLSSEGWGAAQALRLRPGDAVHELRPDHASRLLEQLARGRPVQLLLRVERRPEAAGYLLPAEGTGSVLEVLDCYR